jgi:hypothetical protein
MEEMTTVPARRGADAGDSTFRIPMKMEESP